MAANYRLEDTKFLLQKTVFPDANVFIYRYFPGVNPDKFTQPYGLAYNRLKRQGTRFVATMAILTEVANRVYKEQWKTWREEQIAFGFHPTGKYKKFRRNATGKAMLEEVYKVIRNKILEHVELIDKHFTKAQAKALFVVQDMDLPDKVIAAICKENDYIVFTHDGDFVHTDVDILTANGVILQQQR
jgi:predicted nucleic acid-binding protein